jgi:hypothetical protein
LTIVLYGHEIWFLTSKEEHRQRVFENRVLRKIPGPRREVVTVDWGKKLQSEELHDLCCSQDMVRVTK